MGDVRGVVGQRVRRREDPRLLTGRGEFVDDVAASGALHATFVRSPWAHAEVVSIDAGDARRLDGTYAFTAGDVTLTPPTRSPWFTEIDDLWHRPYLADKKVRFAGEIVAVVLAPTRYASVDAAALVEIEYEPLQSVIRADAAALDEVLLFKHAGSNVCFETPAETTEEAFFDSCDVVVSGALTSQRIAALSIEPRATVARFDEGRLTVWLSTQTPHQDRDALADALGLAANAVRVKAPDVGGAFGAKLLSVEDVLVAWLALTSGRTVRWTETRSESLVAAGHGRGQHIDFSIGGDRDGRVTSLWLNILQDVGAYPGIACEAPGLTAQMGCGAYTIEKLAVAAKCVVTNTTPVGAVRGVGRAEATQVVERAIDAFAAELGLDPADVRRRNFIPQGAFPFVTASGANYDSGNYIRTLELALDRVGYAELRVEQTRRRACAATVQLGIGLSTHVEVTNGGSEPEFAAVELTAEGHVILRTGSFSHGQGHETTFAQIAADRLGLPTESITVIKGDTDAVPAGLGTYSSKSVQTGGMAARQASDAMVVRAKWLVADELEASPHDIVFNRENGRFGVAGAPQPQLSWSELASRSSARGRLNQLRASVDLAGSQPSFPFGTHVAVVEVDTETGAVSLVRLVAVEDAGRLVNPMLAEGQIHGGVAAGIAQALYEELTYDDTGNPQQTNLVTYGAPGATELPSFELETTETPTPRNALGSKGVGEAGTIGATPAVHNAVIDALTPFGVRQLPMPATSERVWRALSDARRGSR